jgi:hypothetical protein
MLRKINIFSWWCLVALFLMFIAYHSKIRREHESLIISYVRSITATSFSKSMIEHGKNKKYKYTDQDIINTLEESRIQSIMYFVENDISDEAAIGTVFFNNKLTLESPLLTKDQKDRLEKYLDVHSSSSPWELSNLFREIKKFF